MLAAAVLTALAWTTLPRSEHPSGVPERTNSPQAAFSIAKRDGAAILTGVEVTAAGVGAASLEVLGEELLAVQAPIHVGVNNFGFKAGTPITNLDARPAHVDTIIQYNIDEAPDYFLLCARHASADGGGESFLVDLPSAIASMSEPHRSRLLALEFIQRIELPPDYDKLSTNDTTYEQEKPQLASDGTAEAEQKQPEAQPPGTWDRVEKFVMPNPRATARPAHRVSSFSDAESLLLDLDPRKHKEPPIRPVPRSAQPRLDMQTVLAYLQAVAAETAQAARFRLAEGDCAVVDNYRVAHGREAYGDLDRALWQIWAWSNTSIAVPPDPGPNREWVRHPSMAQGGNCRAD